jgi:ribosomal protein L37AE/L43A
LNLLFLVRRKFYQNFRTTQRTRTMRNASSDSVSSSIITECNANERLNSVSQLSKTSVNCCPKCQSVMIRQRVKTGDFVCTRCKTIFFTPGALNLRTRKACPHCGAISISKKIFSKVYLCSRCDSTFTKPVLKLVTAEGRTAGRTLSTYYNWVSKMEAV